MIERLLLVAVLFVTGFALYHFMTRRQIKQLAHMPADPILNRVRPGTPAIIYFTTPGCIPCKTQQQPALNRLVQELGADKIQVIQIDATQEPESADRWGVLSAPTTFILDANSQTKAVNHGVADLVKLQKQLAQIA